MDQAMREYDICKAARAEGEAIGQARGEAIGNIQGRQEVLSELISLGILTQEQAEPYMHPAPDDSKAALTQ